jgi:hypothetical protein
MFDVYKFFDTILNQNALEIKKFFNEDAYIDWHNTNERFTVDEFIEANCTYPGKWSGEVERVEQIGNLLIAVAKVTNVLDKSSYYVNSFILLENDKIVKLDEYWGDNGEVPQWRMIKNIGVKIK